MFSLSENTGDSRYEGARALMLSALFPDTTHC
jgi:hypothetical protein